MMCRGGRPHFPDLRILLYGGWMVLAGTALVQPQSITVPRPYAAAAFSVDGTIGAFSQRNALALFSVTSWKTRWSAAVQRGSIAALAFSHDGSRLAAAISDFRARSPLGQPLDYFVAVQIFNAATGRVEKEVVDAKAAMIKDLSFASDGSLLAVVTHGSDEILLWDVYGDRMIPLAPKRQIGYCTAVFAPSGDTLAWATTEPGTLPRFEIRLFDTATRSAAGRVARGTSRTPSIPLAYSRDGDCLAFATEDWDWSNPRPTQIELFSMAARKVTRKIRTKEIAVDSLVFSEDGRTILGSGPEIVRTVVRPVARVSRICLWDVGTGKLQKKVEKKYSAGERRDPALKSMRIPERGMYVFLGAAGNLFFYDSISLQLSGVAPVSYPSGADTATASQIASDLRDMRYAVSAHRILALSFDARGRILAGSSDGTVYSWDIPPGRRFDGPWLGAEAEVMAFSPNAKMIAVSRSSKADVSIVDAISGTTVQSLQAFSDSARALAFSPDGAWLAGAVADGTIRVWSAKNWQAQRPLTGQRGMGATLAFSRDSSLLASGGDDHIIRIWDLRSGAMVHTLPGHKQKISAVVFGAKSDTLASASPVDSCVMLWKLDSSLDPKRLRGYQGSIRSLAFSPDGSSLTGAGDETICLWNSSTGKMIRVLAERVGNGRALPFRDNVPRYVDAMTVMAFTPDGRVMVCGGMNNTLLLWEVATWRNRTLR
jgi:WD40 repeat protein